MKRSYKRSISKLLMVLAIVVGVPSALLAAQSYLAFLSQSESNNNPSAQARCAGCTAQGQYQMTNAALQQVGYMNSSGQWTGKDGVNSQQDYFNNVQAQTNSMTAYQTYNWQQIQNRGMTQYVGQNRNGINWNESSLLDCSYVLGAGGCNTYLQTGQLSQAALNANPNAQQAFANRFAQASQTDASSITSGANTQVANSSTPTTPGGANGSTGLGNTGLYCDPQIAQTMIDGANATVAEQVALAMNGTTGYSLLGGNDVLSAAGLSGNGQGSMGSFMGMSCLDSLLSGGLDIIFNPPNLSSLIDQILNAACNMARSMVSNEVNSLRSVVTSNANVGGFFPGLSAANFGGVSASNIISNSFSVGSGGSGLNFSTGGTTYGTSFSTIMSGQIYTTTTRPSASTIGNGVDFSTGLLGN